MVEYASASVLELSRATQFLHSIKPSLRDRVVFAIEKTQPFDQSVVFHLVERKIPEGVKRGKEHCSVFLLSAEYILEHPFFKGDDND